MISTNTHLCRGLLFDMDGTILDSIPSANRVWGAWAKSVGLGDDWVLPDAVHGRQRPEVIRYVFPRVDEEHIAAHAETVRQGELHDLADVVALPGAADFLSSLPADRWGIVTSCDEEVARARIAAAGLPVPAVLITSDQITASKPNPAGFIAGAEALGLRPDEVVVFEDAPAGVEAGMKAGMRVIANRHTQSDVSVLDGAVALIDSPADLTAAVTDRGIEVTVR